MANTHVIQRNKNQLCLTTLFRHRRAGMRAMLYTRVPLEQGQGAVSPMLSRHVQRRPRRRVVQGLQGAQRHPHRGQQCMRPVPEGTVCRQHLHLQGLHARCVCICTCMRPELPLPLTCWSKHRDVLLVGRQCSRRRGRGAVHDVPSQHILPCQSDLVHRLCVEPSVPAWIRGVHHLPCRNLFGQDTVTVRAMPSWHLFCEQRRYSMHALRGGQVHGGKLRADVLLTLREGKVRRHAADHVLHKLSCGDVREPDRSPKRLRMHQVCWQNSELGQGINPMLRLSRRRPSLPGKQK